MKRLQIVLYVATCLHGIEARATDWQPTGTGDGVATYSRAMPGSDVLAFRGEGLIDLPLARVMTTFLDIPRATGWVDMLDVSVVIERVDELTNIIYQRYDLPFPASDRDYIMKLVYVFDEKRAWWRAVFLPCEGLTKVSVTVVYAR